MYPSALPIETHPSVAYVSVNWSGVLLNVHRRVLWRCEHGHYFDSTARECAEYERQRRLRGR